jgi:pectate lyase
MPQSWLFSAPMLRRLGALLFSAFLLASCVPGTTSGTASDPGGSGGSGSGSGGGGSGGGTGGSDPGPTGPGWENPDDGSGLRAFPGAQGYGTDTPGGRGGKVYVVTTLNWDGPGSFYEAAMATEPRIIVFRVAGVIHVPTNGVSFSEANSYVTVAGQTSPGGITFVGGPDKFIGNYHTNFHDGVFRFLRFRGQGANDDISFNEAHDLVVDHCDFSGAGDESVDITYGFNYTISWSIIHDAEDQQPDGSGGKGAILAYSPNTNISVHHNLWAHNSGRFFPLFHWGDGGVPATGAYIEFSNNVGYNPTWEACMWDDDADHPERVYINCVGNYIKAGTQTPGSCYGFAWPNNCNIYRTDNVFPGHSAFSPMRTETWLDNRVEMPPVTYTPSSQVFDEVLSKVGAFPRDPMTARVVGEAQTGTGVSEKLDDPFLSTSWDPPADTDMDGMPDDWETARGLNPNDPGDASLDRDGDGYTNIEEYINGVAAYLIPN